jgi:hypothetical protein
MTPGIRAPSPLAAASLHNNPYAIEGPSGCQRTNGANDPGQAPGSRIHQLAATGTVKKLAWGARVHRRLIIPGAVRKTAATGRTQATARGSNET